MAFSKIGVAVLAAGASRRFGAPKLLAPLADATLLDRAHDAALGCAADCAVVVTGAYHNEMLPRLVRVSFISGWMVESTGEIRLTTPYGGE